MRASFAAAGMMSAVFLSACGGGGGGSSPVPGGSSNAPTSPASQNYVVSSKQYVVKASSGSVPSVTMNVISVPGLPATGGVAVAKDGAIWWESPFGNGDPAGRGPGGVMVRMQGKTVTTATFPGPEWQRPYHSMTATNDNLVYGTQACLACGGSPPSEQGFTVFSASATDTVTTPHAGSPDTGGILNIANGVDNTVWFVAWGPDYIGGPPPDFISLLGQIPCCVDNGYREAREPYYSTGLGPDKKEWIMGHDPNDPSKFIYSRYDSGVGFLGIVPIPDAKNGLDAIVAGPDSAMWGVGSNTIIRDDINGHDTVYTVGNPQENVLKGITVGGDGALWATDYNAKAVYRITTSGSITTYPLPQGVGQPIQITGPLTSPGCGNSELWVSTVNGPVVQLVIRT